MPLQHVAHAGATADDLQVLLPVVLSQLCWKHFGRGPALERFQTRQGQTLQQGLVGVCIAALSIFAEVDNIG